MRADFLYSPNIQLVMATSLAMLVLLPCNALLGKSLTRPVVMAIGISFIGAGVFGHVTILDMEASGKELVAANLLSPTVFADFNRYKDVFAYFFPAVAVAIGTNVISDALLKHHTYQQAFSFRQFVKDIGFAISLPIGLVVGGTAALLWAVTLPIGPARRYFGSAVPRIWRWSQLKFLKLSIIARHAVRKDL